MVEQESSPQYTPVVDETLSARNYKRVRTIGCVLGVFVWLVLMLIPAFFFILAFRGNITISRFWEDIPDHHEYPVFQINLITESDFRGLSFVNSDLQSEDDLSLCAQTNVRYLLWEGQGENVKFCTCYRRDDGELEWEWEKTTTEACSD